MPAGGGPTNAVAGRSHRFERSLAKLVGAEGFEPSNTGSKGPRLTAWPRPNTPGQTLIVAEFSGIGQPIDVSRVPVMRRAYSRRFSVRVCSDSQPGRARSFAVRRAASARSNRPNTADPDPDIAANAAPASMQRLPDAADRGWCRDHRHLEIVAQRRCPAGQPGGTDRGAGSFARRAAPRRTSDRHRRSTRRIPDAGSRRAPAAYRRADRYRRRGRGRAPCRRPGSTARRRRAARRCATAWPRSRSSFHNLFKRQQRHRGIGAAAAEPGFATARACADRSRCRAAPVLPVAHAVQQRRRLPHQVAAIGRDCRVVAGDGRTGRGASVTVTLSNSASD